LLPKPFSWIKIQAGKVTLTEGGYVPKGGQTFDVPTFYIAKYPVTNAQFAKFVEAGGYTQQKWWTAEGWELLEKLARPPGKAWTEPRYWREKKWNQPDYPVVGVSWYEAAAFCLWLSNITGEKIMLATEQQWQRAAQGDTTRVYPWGGKFDKDRCNMDTQSTTPVTRYDDKGESLFGVADLSGNVWEWCLTNYDTGSQGVNDHTIYRCQRGGAWNTPSANILRVDHRRRGEPAFRSNDIGFRIARML
jgi:formylglycine-generating enzyme required for sulfatase activity